MILVIRSFVKIGSLCFYLPIRTMGAHIILPRNLPELWLSQPM